MGMSKSSAPKSLARYLPDRLSIRRICELWSAELARGDPVVRARGELEQREELECAWWRGELLGDGPGRLSVLQMLFRGYRGVIAFGTGTNRPQATLRRPASVLVPNLEPNSWTEEICDGAFHELAGSWWTLCLISRKVAESIEPLILESEICRPDFIRWTTARGFRRPRFWIVAPRLPSVQTAPQKRPTQKQYESWYRAWMKECDAQRKIPSRNEDLTAARAHFGSRYWVRETDVRELRKLLAPTEWRKQGRRKRSSKS